MTMPTEVRIAMDAAYAKRQAEHDLDPTWTHPVRDPGITELAEFAAHIRFELERCRREADERTQV